MSDDKGLALNLAYSNVSGKKWLKQKWTANYNNNNDTEEHKQRLSLILHDKKEVEMHKNKDAKNNLAAKYYL